MTQPASFKKVFIANRGEVAVRIARAAAVLGIRSVAAFSSDDSDSLHRRRADDFKGIIGPTFGKFENPLNRTLAALNHIRRAKCLGECTFGRVEIDGDDLRRSSKPRALNDV